MALFSYVVARDYGFAPNAFYGFCTLATCMPVLRRCAAVGDWIIGVGGAKYRLRGHIVYAMKVEETLTFDEYWNEGRFHCKRPVLNGSLKQIYGDNIYHRDPSTGFWFQENSHHSHKNGERNPNNIEHDTQSDRVLVSTQFAYWGGQGPLLPKRFKKLHTGLGQGYWKNFPDSLVTNLLNWLGQRGEWGYLGDPSEFSRTRLLK